MSGPPGGTPPAGRPPRLVALVDGSAFYVACERLFDPRLAGVPVAVLSNNDGCVIARSDEVKAAGVRMGEPFFKARARLEALGAAVLSSNYALYGDMSRRLMETLATVAPAVAPYSVDEAFVEVPVRAAGDPAAACAAAEAWAADARARVLRWTGLPVRVSVAETRTLAKAASEFARARLAAGGPAVACLWGHPERAAWLAALPVGSVWGVGRRWAARLEARGVRTAADLAAVPDAALRRHFGAVLARTAAELRGTPAVRLDDAPVRHTLVRSRSFGAPVAARDALAEAVATHAARAAEKLRREGLVAGRVAAFVTTKGVGPGPHRSGWAEAALDPPTTRTPDVLAAARRALAGALGDAEGVAYRKAGVMLSEIRPAAAAQATLFPARAPDAAGDAAQARLMAAVDAANARFGRHAVAFAAMGAPQTLRRARADAGAALWEMRRQHRTPGYTTRWDDLARAVAGR